MTVHICQNPQTVHTKNMKFTEIILYLKKKEIKKITKSLQGGHNERRGTGQELL